jgi:hypothetical protein
MADALAATAYMCPHTATRVRILLLYPYYTSRYILLYIAVSGGRVGGARRARNEVYVSAYAYCYRYVSAYYGMSRYLEGVASVAGLEKQN